MIHLAFMMLLLGVGGEGNKRSLLLGILCIIFSWKQVMSSTTKEA
ncbi:hypothetical protein MtrunA17_Chr1g0194461 [Medicago truncatula]|uniref:Uncharacterized protein n=1 Tax=Medicago truncatula TaxID=3880 RepID=A0A396JY20_MEDTR|nr:hypothetical protein MtrunA17_Chr1g0194461 [Medicago truncatula]